jgi:hypothetical protein
MQPHMHFFFVIGLTTLSTFLLEQTEQRTEQQPEQPKQQAEQRTHQQP